MSRLLIKPWAFPLGGTWAGVTAKETDRRSVRVASKVRIRDIIIFDAGRLGVWYDCCVSAI